MKADYIIIKIYIIFNNNQYPTGSYVDLNSISTPYYLTTVSCAYRPDSKANNVNL